MKNILSNFLKMLSNVILIICFSIASFLIIINVLHYKEISKPQRINVLENINYQEYDKFISDAEKKMSSVNYEKENYKSTAKPIYEYYKICADSLKESTFSGLKDQKETTNLEIYNANIEMLDEYYNKCAFNIVYQIENLGNTYKYKNSFDNIKSLSELKSDIILDNSDYLTKSLLGNSSYSYTSNLSRISVYNKTNNDLKLTINNYKILASILSDIASWYELEFGGNR